MDSHRKFEVLCVDDDTAILTLLARSLGKIDGVVHTVLDDPVEALTLYEQHPGRFALVLTDFEMPQMIGAEFAIRVRLLEKAQPIVVISADPNSCKPEWAFDEVISKPFTPETIEQLVAKYRG